MMLLQQLPFACISLMIGSTFTVQTDDVDTPLSLLTKEIAELRQQQNAALVMIAEIRALLQTPTDVKPQAIPVESAEGQTIDLEGYPAHGAAEAPLTIIEFSDYYCGACAQHVQNVLPVLQRDFIETGKLRYVVIHSLLKQTAQARQAVQASLCAGDQDKFWEMHGRLYAEPGNVTLPRIMQQATQLKLDERVFRECLGETSHHDKLQRGFDLAKQLGVRSIPVFMLCESLPKNGKVKVLRVLVGARHYSALKPEIERALTNLEK